MRHCRDGSLGVVRVPRLFEVICQSACDRHGVGEGHACAGGEVATNGRRRTLRCMRSDSGEREERLNVVVGDGRQAQCCCVLVEPTARV